MSLIVERLKGVKCKVKEGSSKYQNLDFVNDPVLCDKFCKTSVEDAIEGEFIVTDIINNTMIDNCLLAVIENDNQVFVVDLDNLEEVE